MSVSAIQPCKSAIITHMPSSPSLLPLLPSHSSRWPQSAALGSLGCTVTSQQLSTLHLWVYTCCCCFPHLSHSLPLHLCLHSFPASQSVSILEHRNWSGPDEYDAPENPVVLPEQSETSWVTHTAHALQHLLPSWFSICFGLSLLMLRKHGLSLTDWTILL